MNIIDLQERLKDLPENALMQEMQTPTGTAPQFLVLSELKRRKRMRDEYQRQEAQGMQTVAEEAVTAAGMPQEGIMGLAQGMAPRSAIAQDTGVNDMMRQDSVRAPQPEQPMMMAGGGVLKMQPGGFTDRQQQGYLIFLEQMSLQDSPESREMYTRMMERQAASPPAPEFFMRGMDEAPQGIASVSADVSSFLPGMPRADSRPTMMAAPPVLGAAPTADAIDFDASAFETAPAAEPETDEAYLGRLMETAQKQPQSVSDVARALEEFYPGSGYADVMRGGPRMPPEIDATTVTPVPEEEFQENYDFGGGTPQSETGGLGTRIAEGLFGDAVDKVRDVARQGELSREGVISGPVEDQGLSFGLGGMDIPGSGTSLSFGNVTPSAADIPLSTGEPVTDEPIPEFSLGEPVRDPAAPPPVRDTGGGGGGAGGFGPIESRIARMLEEREKSAQADKWLALAQTGLALMASDQPTLGGAIGEAGLAGIGAMQQARSQYDKDIMGLLDMQAGVQRARASGARSTAPKARTPAELKGALDVFEGEVERLAKPIYGPDPSDPLGMTQAIIGYDYSSVPSDVMNNYTRLRDQYLQMFQSPVDVTS